MRAALKIQHVGGEPSFLMFTPDEGTSGRMAQVVEQTLKGDPNATASIVQFGAPRTPMVPHQEMVGIMASVEALLDATRVKAVAR